MPDAFSSLQQQLQAAGWTMTPERSATYSVGDIYNRRTNTVVAFKADCFDAIPREAAYTSLEIIQAMKAGARVPLGIAKFKAGGMEYKQLKFAEPYVTELADMHLEPKPACQEFLLGRADLRELIVIKAVLSAEVKEQLCRSLDVAAGIIGFGVEASGQQECNQGSEGHVAVAYKVHPAFKLVPRASASASAQSEVAAPVQDYGAPIVGIAVSLKHDWQVRKAGKTTLVERALSDALEQAKVEHLGMRDLGLSSDTKISRTQAIAAARNAGAEQLMYVQLYLHSLATNSVTVECVGSSGQTLWELEARQLLANSAIEMAQMLGQQVSLQVAGRPAGACLGSVGTEVNTPLFNVSQPRIADLAASMSQGHQVAAPSADPPEDPPEDMLSYGGSQIEHLTDDSPGPASFDHQVGMLIKGGTSVKYCFFIEKKSAGVLPGRVDVQFTLVPGGRAMLVKVVTENYLDTDFGSCIEQAITQIKFPTFEGPSREIRYPVSLHR